MRTKPLTKTQLIKRLSEETNLERKEVQSVFNTLEIVLREELGEEGIGVLTLPGLLRIKRVHKPRKPPRLNVPNPFRPGEFYDIPEKPAHNVIKIVPLARLKEMV